MNRIALILAVLLLSAFMPDGRAERLIVPMDPYPPWKFVDTLNWDVDPSGIDNRLIEALLSAYNETFGAELEAEYRGYPWKRCLDMMSSGQADLISGILRRPEREEYLIFIEPPYKTRSAKVFYVRKGEGERIRRYEDLHDLKIGLQAGVSYFEPFDSDTGVRKEEAGDDLSNLRKLVHGRIDAVISTETQADYLIAVEGLGDRIEKAPYRYDYELPVYFALSRQSLHADKAARFSDIVTRLVEEDVFETLIEDYFLSLNR
jgi:polar amino acid transport system substrate-binding protein